MGTTVAFCIGLALGLFCGASLGYSLRKEFENDDEFGEFEKFSGMDSTYNGGETDTIEEGRDGSK